MVEPYSVLLVVGAIGAMFAVLLIALARRRRSAGDSLPPLDAPLGVEPSAQASGRSPTRVFVCYRREDTADVAGRIYDSLVARLGRDALFKDVDSIPFGVDYRRSLEQSVEHCDLMLVIIGRGWLSTEPGTGARRLDDPSDFVRIEIEAALRRNVRVIPVFVQGAAPPRAETLPPAVVNLAYRNGLSIRPDPDFHGDMARLIAAIEVPRGGER